MGTKRQKKKAQKFEDKLQKWKDLKAGKIVRHTLAPSLIAHLPLASHHCYTGLCLCSKEAEPQP
jgi:hypothetical protein